MPTPKKISLLPEALDLALYAGDGALIRLTVTDNPGEPIPIGGEVIAHIRKARIDADPAAEFSVDLADAAMGVVLISLTGEQTAGLIGAKSSFKGVWDVQWKPTGGQPVTLVQGQVECNADVTR